jgi:hypothetical protein
LCCLAVVVLAAAAGRSRTPFRAALAIAGVDVAVFALGAESLTTTHLAGAVA